MTRLRKLGKGANEGKGAGNFTYYRKDFHCKDFIAMSTPTKTRNPCTSVQIAAKWMIHHDTISEWTRTNPEFKDAVTRGREIHKAWFHEQIQKGFYDVSDRKGSSRLNVKAVQLYSFLCFNEYESKGSRINLPAEYKTAKYERRSEILIELLTAGEITLEQYEKLDKVLTSQYQRSCGDKILAAEEALKKAESNV